MAVGAVRLFGARLECMIVILQTIVLMDQHARLERPMLRHIKVEARVELLRQVAMRCAGEGVRWYWLWDRRR